jgi:hypothetical protein
MVMSFDSSARFALPLLQSGQAQKELFHNEALTLLDLIVQAAVVDAALDTPPDAPMPGQSWIVGAAPTGTWAGHPNAIAGWTVGGWRFVLPTEGMTAWVAASGLTALYRSGAWSTGSLAASQIVIGGQQVVGARNAAIADPTGGSVVDPESRATLAAILAMLRSHGLIEG